MGNLRFVISVAKSFQNQGIPLIDLISEGNIGLMKAAERYDPSSGFRFISYAVHWVKQTIIASLTDTARTVRVPSNVLQQALKSKKTFNEEDATCYVTYYENLDAESLIPSCVGLFDEINEDGDQLIDLIPNKNADNPEDSLNNAEEIRKRVSIILSVLDERERVIIEKSFGLCGVESNLDDLGEEFGCTKERIRQLRDKSLKKLRNISYDLIKYLD